MFGEIKATEREFLVPLFPLAFPAMNRSNASPEIPFRTK